MSEYNHFDETIWHPDGEHADEDKLHGSGAVLGMLALPEMPYGDGTYYQTGAFYACDGGDFDSNGRPIIRVGNGRISIYRKMQDLVEWVEANSRGEEAVLALEAGRQNKRLDETGVARCFKFTDICPGAKRLGNCAAGNAAFTAAQEWAGKNGQEKTDEGRASKVIDWAGSSCLTCSIRCDDTERVAALEVTVSVKTIDGLLDETRVAFRRTDPNIPVIEVDTAAYRSQMTINPDRLQKIRTFFEGMSANETSENIPQ